MKIGIIGYGKQSKKIIEKIKKFKEISKIVVFKKSNFKEKISKLYFTNNIKDLDSLEIIFILSRYIVSYDVKESGETRCLGELEIAHIFKKCRR